MPSLAEVVRRHTGTADKHVEVITWNDERDDGLQPAFMPAATDAHPG
jgi:hypothetical protein